MSEEIILKTPVDPITVTLIRSSRRTISLEVGPSGQVVLRAPKRAPKKMLQSFLEERKDWIAEKYQLMEQLRREEAERGPKDYELDPEKKSLYRRQAGKVLAARTAYYAEQMQVDYGRITIKETKTRWGSCSGKGNLNFHWKLILMPPEVLDYVVVHELAHRKEMNHSERFWRIVGSFLPDYKECRKWLRENGRKV